MKTPRRGAKKVAISHPPQQQLRGILKKHSRYKTKKKVRFNPKPEVCLSQLQLRRPGKLKRSLSRSASDPAVHPQPTLLLHAPANPLDQPSTSTSCLHTSCISKHVAGPRLRPFLPRKTKVPKRSCLKHTEETGAAGSIFMPHPLPVCAMTMPQTGQCSSAHAQPMEVSVTECDQLSTELNNLDLSLWENTNNNAGEYDTEGGEDTVAVSHPVNTCGRVDDLLWCPVLHCCCVFSNADMLQRHLSQMNHSPCNPLREAQADDVMPEVVTFLCPQCGDAFNNAALCAEHMVVSSHLVTMAPLPVSHYACPTCLLMFPTCAKAAVHMHYTRHYYSCLGFEDDQARKIPAPIPVPASTAFSITRRCSSETFTVTCRGCDVSVATPGDLGHHLDRGCIVAASSSKTVRDVVVSMVTDQTCAGCRQFIIGRSDAIYGVHLGCPGQGYIMSMAARSLAEFLRRCGISSLSDVLEETLENERNEVKPNKTRRNENEKALRCYDTIEASAAFDKAIDDMFHKYHTPSMAPVFSRAASCSSRASCPATGDDVNSVDTMTSSYPKPATCLTHDLNFLGTIDMIDNQIDLLSGGPFGEAVMARVDTIDTILSRKDNSIVSNKIRKHYISNSFGETDASAVQSDNRSANTGNMSMVTNNIQQPTVLKTKQVEFRHQRSNQGSFLRKTKRCNRQSTLKRNIFKPCRAFNKSWKKMLTKHHHVKGAQWTKLIQKQYMRNRRLRIPQTPTAEICSHMTVDYPQTCFNVQDCFVLLNKLDMRKYTSKQSGLVQPFTAVSKDKCFENTEEKEGFESTEGKECLETLEEKEGFESTAKKECLETTEEQGCVDKTKTKERFDTTDMEDCLETTEANEYFEKTGLKECFERTESETCNENAKTIPCFESIDTEGDYETSETNDCLETTHTKDCFETTEANEYFEITEAETCYKNAKYIPFFETIETEDSSETKETNACFKTTEINDCFEATKTKYSFKTAETNEYFEIKETTQYVENKETFNTEITQCSNCTTTEQYFKSTTTGKCYTYTEMEQCFENQENKLCLDCTDTIQCFECTIREQCSEKTGTCDEHIKIDTFCEITAMEHYKTTKLDNCEIKNAGHCEASKDKYCERKDTNHSKSRDTGHCQIREAKHPESKETNHCEIKETNDCESKEINQCESKETNKCEIKETNVCEIKELNHCESKKMNDPDSKEKNDYKRKETNDCESKETNHFENTETNRSGSKESNDSDSKENNDYERQETNDCESKETNDRPISKNDCFLGRRHRRISTVHSFLTLREGLRTKPRDASKKDGYYRALNSPPNITSYRDRSVHRRLGTKM